MDLPCFYELFRAYFYDRREFLMDNYRNPERYVRIWFYDARWGNLWVPAGTDLKTYLEGATLLEVNTPGENFLGWYVDDTPLEQIGIVSEDLSVRGYYEEIRAAEETGWAWRNEIGLVLVFAGLALGIFLFECKRMRRK